MAFGPRMQLEVPAKAGGTLTVLLAPLSKEAMPEFVKSGGMQSYEVSRYLGSRAVTAPVLEDEYDWFEKVRMAKDSIVWGIFVLENDKWKPIGNTALNSLEYDCMGIQATSGVLIFDQAYWGKGIASYIHRARTWFAFTQVGVRRIKSAVIHGNTASRKALEGCGYTLVYVERQTAFVNGEPLHQDNLQCINPLEPFWRSWWQGQRVPKKSQLAKSITLEVLEWAENNVKLL